MSTVTTGAEAVEWNLGDLYDGPDDPRIESELEESHTAAKAFRERFRGKLGELSAAELNDAVAELERIESSSTRVETYARLRQAADSTDQARGALVQRVRERNTQIETELLFFDLEWSALDDDVAERLLADPAIERYAQVLRSQRRYKPHQLSEPEEKISAEKSLTGVSAWGRLFNELVSDLSVSLDGNDLSLDEALAKLARETSQEERGRVAEAVTETLRPGVRTRGYVLNTILNERAIEDRLRDYETWISARNLANEIPDEAAQSLVDAIQARYDIPQRFYALKARLLGLERLKDYDRFAPLQEVGGTIAWDEAQEIVLDAFNDFSPQAGAIIGDFFEKDWIDAALRPGKMLGAFCATTVPGVHPYVLMNYAGERRSVLTLAHELGHGLHGSLAQDLGLLNARTPLTLAETASVFAEALTFEKLKEREDDPRALLDLLVGRIDDTVATVFRQIALNRFEHAIHTGRREEGELTDRAHLRALERGAAAHARRRGRGHGQLRDLVELRAALHPGAGIRLRVLVRLPLLARDLPALPRGGRVARRAVSRPPACGWLGAAGRAGVAARLRHRRPRVLVGRDRRDRRPRRRGRAARRPARQLVGGFGERA